jgi:hypothetical protein
LWSFEYVSICIFHFFNIFSENHKGVRVLLHAADWALHGRLEPPDDALGVEAVPARQLAVRELHLLEAYGARVHEVRAAQAVLCGPALALQTLCGH